MEAEWRDSGNVWYLTPAPNPHNTTFFGAYGAYTKVVYRNNGTKIQDLPGDLTLDDALAVAKIIIMTDRAILDRQAQDDE